MSECTVRRQPEATANYKCLFFLDVGHDVLRPSKNGNQSHMVSYCSAIKVADTAWWIPNILFKYSKTLIQKWTSSHSPTKRYLSHENISIANFLSTFRMASESCLNNLHLTQDQREWLFEHFCATTDGSTREQIMQQLFGIT